MSPSRGFRHLRRQFMGASFKRTLATFPDLSASKTPIQIYISTSHSPFLNLSIEHHLFQTTPENSTVLFLYTNTPSIVIGRNQNPWVEVNLPLLHKPRGPTIHLVRRRSGGGTVFHDMGNVNYSVCMPSVRFDRDKHAEMVVRALHGLGIRSATVNKRHDIVLLPDGMAAEGTRMETETPEGTNKVSGSAFKLNRLRSYHHGTMLLDSRLDDVRSYLNSPARGWLKARGVDSVRSPVKNIGVERETFIRAVVEEFGKMYLDNEKLRALGEVMNGKNNELGSEELGFGVCYVGEEALGVEKVRMGVDELEVRVSLSMGKLKLMYEQSPDWIFGQTPQLTFSVPSPEFSPIIPGKVPQPPEGFDISITANKGIIEQADSKAFPAMLGLVGKNFDGGVIHDHILGSKGTERKTAEATASWIESILGRTKWRSSKPR